MVKTPGWGDQCAEVGKLLRPALPLFANVVVSGTVFTAGSLATQVLAKSCRISSATPILAPALGFAGVGLTAAAVGQAAIFTQQRFERDRFAGQRLAGKQRQQSPQLWQPEDLVLDAMVGLLLFKMLGGRFRNTLPSDLFQRGSFAVESLPATGSVYASETHKAKLRRFMIRDGCHHCGRKHGRTVGDHIPPNKLVHGSKVEQFITSERLKQLWEPLSPVHQSARIKATRRHLPIEAHFPNPGRWFKSQVQHMFHLPESKQALKQRYYPQCASCSQHQAAAVRTGRRTLILHFGGPRPWHLAGILVGLRHFVPGPGIAAASFTRTALDHFGAMTKKPRH
eukprot:jgi/Botrbrau1/11817/Bobra.0224s0016.1